MRSPQLLARLQVQHGVVTRGQARDDGLTNHQIDRLIAAGQLVAIHRGVFRHGAVRLGWRSRAMAAALATGGVVSHRAAAALWGLEVVRRPLPEVTIDAARSTASRPGVIVHRTASWPDVDRQLRHGIATTGIERTILDCAAVVAPSVLERLAESAIRQELTSWAELRASFELHRVRGRDGIGAMGLLLDARLSDCTVPRSDFSRRVAHLLERHGLAAPSLEYPIHDDDGNYLLLSDLAWPSLMAAVELDGMAHHFGRAERERDIAKRAAVRAAGWRLLELSWRQYDESPAKIAALVARFLRNAVHIQT